MGSGFFAAADLFRGISADAFRTYGQQQVTQARFDAANAIARDEDGYIKPVRLYQPGSYYGDAFNQAAITSYVAAARTSAHEQFRLAAVRNSRDPETFDAFVKTWIERQTSEAPAELRGALKLDLAEVGGQFKASILSNVLKDQDAQRHAALTGDAENQLRDMYGYSVAGDAAGLAKASQEVESLATALEAAHDYKGAVELRQHAQRIQRVGPIMGRADALWRQREAGAAGEGPLDGYLALVGQAESGGDGTAKNPHSSATGLYQFIDSTWLDQVKRNHPDLAAGNSDGEILALRQDKAIQGRVMRSFTSENYDLLRRSGVVGVGRGELYLAHFLGAGGAAAALTADPSTPLDQIKLGNGERAVPDKAIKANKFLAGMTAGDVRAWAARKMGDTAAAATLEGKYGTGVDVLSALSADIQSNPAKYGYSELEARQAAGMVQSHAAVLQAAKSAEVNTKTADLAFNFGKTMQDFKNQIDAMDSFDPVSDPGKFRAAALGIAGRFGKDPDSISTELINYARASFDKRNTLAETIKDLAVTRSMGGRPPANAKTLEAVDWLTKRAYGHELSVFDGNDHTALGDTFSQLGLLPTYAVRQLQNIHALADAGDEKQVGALENAVGFVERLAGGKGMSYVTEHFPDLIGKPATDRIVELMGERGSSLIRHNERMNLARSNVENWRAERWAQLGDTPEKQQAKLGELVAKETAPGMLAQAAASALSLGGDNALSQWLAPRTDERFRELVTKNALANVPEFTKPEAAVEAAAGEARKVSAYSTYLRRPGDDLTPKLRPYAPEAFYPADVFRDDLVGAVTAKLNTLRVKEDSWAKDIGQLAGLAAAAVQQPVLNGDILSKLAAGGFAPISRDLTELDVKKMLAAGLIELQVSQKPTPSSKPAYRVFLNHEDRYLPIIDAFRPSDRPGAEVEAARAGTAWARRFAEDTGLKIPAVVPGMAIGVYNDLLTRLGSALGDPLERSQRDLHDLTGAASGAYQKLRKESPPAAPYVPGPLEIDRNTD
ncbi:lytic transglycosylase domain-containing protein [Azospirillum sp. sgz301742]